MDAIQANTTVAAASAQYHREAQQHGSVCPVCQRFGREYMVHLGAAHLWALHAFYKKRPRKAYERLDGGFLYFRDVLPDNLRSSYGQLKHWGLLEPRSKAIPGRAGKSGYWRITPAGKAWLRGQRTVPASAVVSRDGVLRFEGAEIGPSQALKQHFDLGETMDETTAPAPQTATRPQQAELFPGGPTSGEHAQHP